MGLLAFAGTPGIALGNGLPGLQEPATPQAGTTTPAASQDTTKDAAQDASRKKLDKPDDADPLKRRLSDKQKFQRQKELKQ